MSNLSERNIKKSTLSFLKGYYKNRPRDGETDASIDMRGEGGIIADGFLSFQTEEGNNFVSTFEATSLGTKDEVRYKVQTRKLIWDALCIGSLLATVWLCWNYYEDVRFLEVSGYSWVASVIGTVIGVIFVVFVTAFWRSQRYRYIYAVEQFKQYHANEQWISIGEDVFLGPEDKYLRELKDQCIQNGFGLIKVNDELKPHLIVTPARQDTFKKQRRMIQFLPLNDVTKRLQGFDYRKWIGWLFRPAQGLSRFYARNSLQISIAGLCWLIILGIFIVELSKEDIEYANEAKYPEQLAEQLKDRKPEPNFDIISDTFLTRDTMMYLDTVRYFREIVYFEKTSLIQPLAPKTLPYIEMLELEKKSSQVRRARKRGFDIVLTLEDNTSLIVYSCERFYNLRTPKYIVEEGVYQDLDLVIDRIQALRKQGVSASTIWLGCFSEEEGGYSLYFDLLHDNREEALETMRDYKLKLERLEKMEKSLRIRRLLPEE